MDPETVAAALILRDALLRVRNLTVGQVAALWGRIVDPERIAETAAVFGTVAAAVMVRGQRAAVMVADAWAARVFGRPPVGLDPGRFIGAAETEVALPDVLASSGAYVARAVHRGAPVDLALDAGRYRAARLTSTETMRAGLDAVAVLAEGEGSPGWRRRTTSTACEVCRGLADGTLRPWDERVAAHPHCSCIPVPEVVA